VWFGLYILLCIETRQLYPRKKLLMTRTLNLFLAIPLLILASGCSGGDAQSKGVSYASALKESIIEYEKGLNKFDSAIADVKLDSKALTSGDSKTSLAALTRFQEQWQLAKDECEALQGRLDTYKAAAADHFEHLAEIGTKIPDAKMRTRNHILNKASAERWGDALRKAETSMDGVWTAIAKGDGLYNYVLSAVLRSSIDDTIVELQSIQDEAARLVLRLSQLAEEGKGLTI
jgi:chromosome segregation ATPase